MADDFSGDIHTEGKVAVNGMATGNINFGGDHDWFRVQLQAGVKYRFDTVVGTGVTLFPEMSLFDSSGLFTGVTNDAANESLNPEFFFQPLVSGTYFVDVDTPDTVPLTGAYKVSVTVDDFAAGVSTTGEVTPDGPAVSGNIETVGDHDWLKVQLSGAHHYVLHESGASSGSGTLQDPLMTLFGFPQTNFVGIVHSIKLTQDDNSGPGLDSRLDITTTGRFTSVYLDAGSANNGTGSYTVSVTTADTSAAGISDVLWRSDNGQIVDWTMDGGAITSSAALTMHGSAVRPDASWSIAATSDFNGDGEADILWRNTSGELVDWTMAGSSITSSAELTTANGATVRPDASWSVAATGDFNDDGKADILWRNAGGELVEWTMNGPSIVSSGDVTAGGLSTRPDASWSIASTGDFNGDGKADLLWRNAGGEIAVWAMNGSTISGSADVTANGAAIRLDASWSVAGTGDFDGDGNADVLWRNTDGELVEWNMHGSVIASSGVVSMQNVAVAPDASWHVVQIGDGQSDILWRNDSGALAEWLMNGPQIVSSMTPGSGGSAVQPDASWHTAVKPTNLG